MKRFFLLLSGLFFLSPYVYGGGLEAAEQLEKALHQSVQNTALNAARSSVVQIKIFWQNERGQSASRLCKGVLVNGEKRVVSHGNCLLLPASLGTDGKVQKISLHFHDGKTLNYAGGLPQSAGRFIYWDLPPMQFDSVEPAVLLVFAEEDAQGQLQRDEAGNAVSLAAQNFVFCGREHYRFCTMKDEADQFTLHNVLRERQIGEPVFIGRRVVALNAVGAAETFVWGKTLLQPPVFTVFTNDNGGAQLMEKNEH